MAAPTAASSITQLHNELAWVDLGNIAAIERIIWRARALVRDSPNGIGPIITLARALMIVGQREEALDRAMTAYQLQITDKEWLLEVGAVLISLGITPEAEKVVREILVLPAISGIETAQHIAMITGVIAGNIELLEKTRVLEEKSSREFAGPALDALREAGLENYFSRHMEIILNNVKYYVCSTNVSVEYLGAVPNITARYWLNCNFKEMIDLRRSIDKDLLDFYNKMTTSHLPYVNALTHSLSILPSVRSRTP
jgi:hypothetical protein